MVSSRANSELNKVITTLTHNTYKHTKLFYASPNKNKMKYILKGTYTISTWIKSISINHSNLAYFQSKLNPETDPTCRLCKQSNETLDNVITNQISGNLSQLTDESSLDETNQTVNKQSNKKNLNVILTNARSLAQKFDSMVDYFRELDLTAAVVTESWLKPGESVEELASNLKDGERIGLIHCSRISKRGRTAGGESRFTTT